MARTVISVLLLDLVVKSPLNLLLEILACLGSTTPVDCLLCLLLSRRSTNASNPPESSGFVATTSSKASSASAALKCTVLTSILNSSGLITLVADLPEGEGATTTASISPTCWGGVSTDEQLDADFVGESAGRLVLVERDGCFVDGTFGLETDLLAN